jgi:GPH family glycoside/pentoside/hexuronide:cation symporter
VPYSALTPELTHDYDERTSLSSYRFAFSILGGVLAASLHKTIVDAIAPGAGIFAAHLASAAIWAFFIITPNFITFAFTRETHFKEERPEGPGFWEGLRIVFQNKAFVAVAFIRLLSWLSVQFIQANLLLYVRYWVGGEKHFPILILAIQVSSFLFMLLWNQVSAKIGKKKTYYVGMSFMIAVLFVMFFVQEGQIALLFVLGVLAGGGVGVSYLIPWSMIPDVVELDELETGQRREGIYYGFFVFLQKLGISLGLMISNAILEATGYINPVAGQAYPQQPQAVLMALRTFVSFAPVIIVLLSFIAVYVYPITREKHAEMRVQLAKRRAEA